MNISVLKQQLNGIENIGRRKGSNDYWWVIERSTMKR